MLSQPLVEHLHRGREHYDMFVNEDVTVGSWLLGVSTQIDFSFPLHDLLSPCASSNVDFRSRRARIFAVSPCHSQQSHLTRLGEACSSSGAA